MGASSSSPSVTTCSTTGQITINLEDSADDPAAGVEDKEHTDRVMAFEAAIKSEMSMEMISEGFRER